MCTAADCQFLWVYYYVKYCASPFRINGIIAVVKGVTFLEPECMFRDCG